MKLRRLSVTFNPEGLQYAVVYQHEAEPPAPGTKTRTRSTRELAREGLAEALKALEGDLVWSGFATDTRTSRDVIVADRSDS